jgi:hypothetical protein
MIRRFLGIGLIVAFILTVIAFYLSTIVQPAPSASSITPAQKQLALDRLNDAVKNPEHVKSRPTPTPEPFFQKTRLSKVEKKAPSGDIQVRFNEDDINTMLPTNKDVQKKMQRIGASAAKIHFVEPNQIQVTTWVIVNNIERQFTISGILSSDNNGSLIFHTDGSEVGELPLPAGMTASKLDGEAAKLLEMVKPVLPLNVRDVQIVGSQLIFSGPEKSSQTKE